MDLILFYFTPHSNKWKIFIISHTCPRSEWAPLLRVNLTSSSYSCSCLRSSSRLAVEDEEKNPHGRVISSPSVKSLVNTCPQTDGKVPTKTVSQAPVVARHVSHLPITLSTRGSHRSADPTALRPSPPFSKACESRFRVAFPNASLSRSEINGCFSFPF